MIVSHCFFSSSSQGEDCPLNQFGSAMRFPSTILLRSDGRWTLRHESREIGQVAATAATREQAVEKLRAEIRYRLELCPCSGVTLENIEIDVLTDPLPGERKS
jgi:hypothetical protein